MKKKRLKGTDLAFLEVVKGGQQSCTPPTLRSQIWISFLKMLAFTGKWVGFPIPSLQGSRSARRAKVPTKLLSLSFDAREFPVLSQRDTVSQSHISCLLISSGEIISKSGKNLIKKTTKINHLTRVGIWLDAPMLDAPTSCLVLENKTGEK